MGCLASRGERDLERDGDPRRELRSAYQLLQLFRIDESSVCDLRRVRARDVVQLTEQYPVELVLNQTGDLVLSLVEERPNRPERDLQSKLFCDSALGGGDELLAGLWMTATAVRPHEREVVLAGRTLLNQQPTISVEEEHREREMQRSRRAVRVEFVGDPDCSAIVVDEDNLVAIYRLRHVAPSQNDLSFAAS